MYTDKQTDRTPAAVGSSIHFTPYTVLITDNLSAIRTVEGSLQLFLNQWDSL